MLQIVSLVQDSDAHNLRPCRYATRNTSRNNKKFTAGSGTNSHAQFLDKWYPGDQWKGDVARIVMYMYLAIWKSMFTYCSW